MASDSINRPTLADRVASILESSKVNLSRQSKACEQLVAQVREEILGAPKADRRDCVVRKGKTASKGKTRLLVGPGGTVQMTSAESERADRKGAK